MKKGLASLEQEQLVRRIRTTGPASISILGGIAWVILTYIGATSSGTLENVVIYVTEPAIAISGLLGIYGITSRISSKFRYYGQSGYYLLITGFVIIGIFEVLNTINPVIPSFSFSLRQPDSFLLTTVVGICILYIGFFLLGIEFRSWDLDFGNYIPFFFIITFPLGIVGVIIAIVAGATTWISTIVTAPSGVGMVLLGYVLIKSNSL